MRKVPSFLTTGFLNPLFLCDLKGLDAVRKKEEEVLPCQLRNGFQRSI